MQEVEDMQTKHHVEDVEGLNKADIDEMNSEFSYLIVILFLRHSLQILTRFCAVKVFY